MRTTKYASRDLSHIAGTRREASEEAEQAYESVSLSPMSSIIEQTGFRTKASSPDQGALSTFKTSQSFSPGISEILKLCLLIHVSSVSVAVGHRMSLFRACILLLKASPKKSGAQTINVIYRKSDISDDLDGLYTKKELEKSKKKKTLTNLIPCFHS